MSQSLPAPDAVAQAHSQELLTRLIESAQHEPIPFSTYMQRCLYEPGLGYYMAGSQKFGAQGDFVTAPEVSPLFGACIAEQCREVLAISGGGILELGAGSGRLALSLIQALHDEQWAHYSIVEPSAELQARQAELLKTELSEQQFAKVQWLSTLPEAFSGVVLANEVMDALPVERWVKTNSGLDIEALGLSSEEPTNPVTNQLQVQSVGADDLPSTYWGAVDNAVAHVEKEIGGSFEPGYRSEVSLMLPAWIHSLADCLTQGILLLIDYGYPRREYYLDERIEGTLQCFYRHHAHDDVTFWPGLQDITAHVDFTAVIEAGDSAGLDLMGYTAQAPFLFGCGIPEKMTTQSAVWGGHDTDSAPGRIQHQQALNRLTLPGEMGERFQVMALGRGIDASLRGFSLLDLSHRL